MTSDRPTALRILCIAEHAEQIEHVAALVTRLGHVVIGTETDHVAAAALTDREPVDVAIVAVAENTERALTLIGAIVRNAACPVIAVLDVEDPAFVRMAAKRGLFAYITDGETGADQLESAIEVVLHRFAEYHDLEGAFGRRAITERAKGILMERHGVDEHSAFLMLRDRARNSNRKLIDIAQAVLEARALLPSQARPSSTPERRGATSSES